MKKSAAIIFTFFGSVFAFAQTIPCYYYEISFEGTGTMENAPCHWMYNDTVSNPANIWQIGPPQKTVFSSAYSNPNVIVTDTISPYPVNDTSSFILAHLASQGITITNQISISGRYSVNSDTISDIGKIEFSPDNGVNWFDLIDTAGFAADIFYPGFDAVPELSGNSGGWREFTIVIGGMNPGYNIQFGDTILWRFTFMSDGINTFKDGLMFDSIYVIDAPPVGITGSDTEEILTIFPNPTSGYLVATVGEMGSQITVINLLGEKIFEAKATSEEVKIDLSSQSAGIYFLKVQMASGTVTRKIVKN